MTDEQRAGVTNSFFNATKEKILGNFDNASATYSEVIRKDPTNAAAMYELANIYSEQKKYSDALFFSKSAYNLDKSNTWYVIAYSDILQKNKKFSESAVVLERLVHDYPNRPDFYYEWANALIFSDKPGDAVKVYDKLEQQIGITSDVSIRKARLYQRMNKNEKAIEELGIFEVGVKLHSEVVAKIRLWVTKK